MSDLNIDIIGRKLLNLVQQAFPLTREPYLKLGHRLGISESEVIRHIERLKIEGVIRQISPVLDARRLGYQSTLVATKVAKTELDRAEQLLVRHPGVSHGYERDHRFNLWFTLSRPPLTDMDAQLLRLTSAIGAEVAFALPAIKLFKIGAYFDMDGDEQTATLAPSSTGLPGAVELCPEDRRVINALQQDLPLTPAPFTSIATEAGMDMADFLTHCQSLRQRGVIRHFSAAINHRKVGFKANGMTCWVVPPDMVNFIGRWLASLQTVSHCYERKTNPLWPYNLFAMFHSYSREVCQNMVSEVSRQMGLKEYVILFSNREFKKTRIKYLV